MGVYSGVLPIATGVTTTGTRGEVGASLWMCRSPKMDNEVVEMWDKRMIRRKVSTVQERSSKGTKLTHHIWECPDVYFTNRNRQNH